MIDRKDGFYIIWAMRSLRKILAQMVSASLTDEQIAALKSASEKIFESLLAAKPQAMSDPEIENREKLHNLTLLEAVFEWGFHTLSPLAPEGAHFWKLQSRIRLTPEEIKILPLAEDKVKEIFNREDGNLHDRGKDKAFDNVLDLDITPAASGHEADVTLYLATLHDTQAFQTILSQNETVHLARLRRICDEAGRSCSSAARGARRF